MLPTIPPEKIAGPVSTQHFVLDWLVRNNQRVPFPSPLLNPAVCMKMLREFHNERGVKYSWGDYGANREVMWAGFYGHQERKYIHLGVDVFVTSGTPVCVDDDVKVLLVDNDHPDPQGWGRRVVVYSPKHDMCLVYAHLAPKVRCKTGDFLKAGSPLGHVGISRHNGQWFPHLHVQAVQRDVWNHFSNGRLHEFDGYCSEQEWPRATQCCPNPVPFVQIP